MKRNRRTARPFSYGSLEPKRMLAGNVNANFQGEHIFIRGDQFDNQLQIDASNGQIRIRGTNGTTINNRSSVIVDNSFFVGGSSRADSEFAGGLRIHLGPGNDSLDIEDIRLNEFSIIYGGTGNDNININSTEFIDSALVQTFTGNDDVTFSNTLVTDTLFAVTHDGNDSLVIENSDTLGSAIVSTGNGDDFLRLDSNRHQGTPQFFLTNNGDDTVELQNINVGTGGLELYTGNGNDEVNGELTSGVIDGNVIIAGQANSDFSRLDISSNVASRISLRGFEFNDEIVHQNADAVDFGLATFAEPGDSFFVADFVEFPRTTRLSSIEWLGSYDNSDAPLTDDFVIEIYEGGFVEDENIGTYQAPVGNPIATFNVGNDANRVDTGATWSVFGPSRNIFSYSADIDFTFSPNTQFWISIYAIQPAGFANDYFTLAEDIESELTDPNNGAATVKFPQLADWFPNTSGKTHFTLRS